jgi:hypothetical protein
MPSEAQKAAESNGLDQHKEVGLHRLQAWKLEVNDDRVMIRERRAMVGELGKGARGNACCAGLFVPRFAARKRLQPASS